MQLNNQIVNWGLLSFLLFGFYLLSFELQRTDTLSLLLTFSGLFFLLWFWIRNFSTLTSIFLLGIVCRLIFWNHIPALSQDFYRFIWDGNIQLLGINPYRYTPDEIINLIDFPSSGILYEKMGNLSNNHYSNYPPISQYLFQFIAYFNRGDILQPIFALRIIYMFGELFLFFGAKILFEHFKIPSINIAWYFLNPLVIVEGFGNLHGEPLMITFTVFSWLYCFKKKPVLGGFFMTIAVGTKLLPLLLTPIFFRYLGLRKFLIYSFSLIIFSCVLWLPFLSEEMIKNYTQTIQLWFTTFEFNGSIYNIIRAIGYEIKGYNIIRQLGKITPFITILFVIIFSLLRANFTHKEIYKNMLLLLSCYFFIATTVHPWYIINLILLGLLTGYFFPILWSMTVFWSYSAYGFNVVEEKIGYQLVSYVLVYGCFFFEMNKRRLGKHLHKPNFFAT
jgi:hypothetical protein